MINRKILILILLSLVVFFGIAIFSPKNKLEDKVEVKQPSFTLSPETSIIHQNSNLSLDILIDTGNTKSSGAGAILHFNPAVFEVINISQGEMFGLYPSKKIDNNNGEIKISGVSWDSKLGKPSLPFSGKGIFAKVNLKAKILPGEIRTPITFYYKNYGNTIDSNIIDAKTAKDVLKTIKNIEITIKQ